MNRKMMIIGIMLMALGIANAYSFTQPLTADQKNINDKWLQNDMWLHIHNPKPLTTDEKRIIEWLGEWYAGAPDHDIPYKWLCQHYIPLLSYECHWLREQKNATDIIISNVDERIALNHKIIEALLEFQGSTQIEIERYMQIYG